MPPVVATWDPSSVVVVITAFGGMLVTVVAAISAAVLSYRASVSSQLSSDASRLTVVRSDRIIEKAEQIHTLTNSNLSKVTAALEVALMKIEGLQNLIVALSQAKLVSDASALKASDISLARNQALFPTPVVASSPSMQRRVDDALKTIESDRAHIAAAVAETVTRVDATTQETLAIVRHDDAKQP